MSIKKYLNIKRLGSKKKVQLLLTGLITIIVVFFSYSYVEASVDKAFDFVNKNILKNEAVIHSSDLLPIPSPSPSLIECFISGKSVFTTKENCQELSVQKQEQPAVVNNPTPKAVIPQKTITYSPSPSVDPNKEIVKCTISPNCGGGFKEMTRESCQNTVCCKLEPFGLVGYYALNQNAVNNNLQAYIKTA